MFGKCVEISTNDFANISNKSCIFQSFEYVKRKLEPKVQSYLKKILLIVTEATWTSVRKKLIKWKENEVQKLSNSNKNLGALNLPSKFFFFFFKSKQIAS